MSDSFAEMDRAYGAGVVRDPYPTFQKLRRECPVQPLTTHEMFGIGLQLPRPDDAPPIFTVLSHETVSEVLRDGERFSSKVYEQTMGLVMGRTILQMDEPAHRRYRGLVQKAFTKKALERWESDLIQPVVNSHVERWERDLIRPVVTDHVERFAARGHADLRRELTFPFPVTVIAGMLGLDEDDLEDFHRWAVELISIGFDFQRSVQASKVLGEYLAGLVAERRDDPRDDLTSVLAHAELDGNRLSDDDIIGFLRLLLPAGAETTYRSLSNLIFALLTHTDQLEALRRDRSLLDAAIAEGLRWEPPITGIIRQCTRDTELAGVKIPQGAMIGVCLAAANHDESRYENPDAFDIFRPLKQSMEFGFGAHRCLGMHLARSETRVAIETLLDRFPDLHLDPEAEDVHVTGLVFRTPTALPVRFTPA